MTESNRPPLGRGALDRDAATRADQELLSAAWCDPRARLLRIRGVEVPVVARADGDDEGVRLALVPTEGAYAAARDGGAAGHLYLGRIAGAPVFGEALRAAGADGDERTSVDPVSGGSWRHPFEIGDALEDTERELIAVLSALAAWHASAPRSSRDGSATDVILGGWARRDARGAELFPRTDPAVIVVIEHRDRILLGSNALWEAGRFSLLAGFVEAGESLEQAVSREVFEESGMRLDEIRYVASQPWPFPRSLMLGFTAKLADDQDPDALVADPEEISELRWFTRDELRNPVEGLILPMPLSIARWLIDRWIDAGDVDAD